MSRHTSAAGFSLLEAMVAMAILGVAIVFASRNLMQVEEMQGKLSDKMKARHVIDRTISSIIANAGFYPPMVKGGKRATYISCFNAEGVRVENKFSSSHDYLTFLDDPKALSDVCKKAKLVMHVTPAIDGSNQADLHIFAINRETKKVKIEYATTVVLESSI